MTNIKSRLLTVLFALVALLQAATSFADIVDVALSTGSTLRRCPVIGVCALPSPNRDVLIAADREDDLGVTGSVSSQVVDPDDPLTKAGSSVGFQGEPPLPAVSAYAYAGDQRRITVSSNGFQRYEVMGSGELVLTGTLTYTQSGQTRPDVTANPRGRVGGNISVFRMNEGISAVDGSVIPAGVLDTDRCNLGPLFPDIAVLLGACVEFNGLDIGDGTIGDFSGYEELGRTFFNQPDGPIVNGTSTVSLTIDVGDGDVVFIGGAVGVFANLNGFGDTRNTLLVGVDDPSRLEPTAVLDPTFEVAQAPSFPSEGLLQQLETLVTEIGPGKSFADKIALAQVYLSVPDIEATCAILGDFLRQASAQSGKKKLTTAQADELATRAQDIMSEIGCD